MGNNSDQTCTFTGVTDFGTALLRELSTLEEWERRGGIPYPVLAQYADDIPKEEQVELTEEHLEFDCFQALSQMTQYNQEYVDGKIVVLDKPLGVFRKNASDPKRLDFFPYKEYLAHVQKWQGLKWISDMDPFKEEEKQFWVIFTSNWTPQYEFFTLLGLQGINVEVDIFEEFMNYAGAYTIKNGVIEDIYHEEEDAVLWYIERHNLSVGDFWSLPVGEYDSYDKFIENEEYQNERLLAKIKEYYEKK